LSLFYSGGDISFVFGVMALANLLRSPSVGRFVPGVPLSQRRQADCQHRRRAQRATNRRRSGGRMTLRLNGSNHGKDSDSEKQAEKHNLCSLVTEQANAGSRQIQRGGASEHSHRAKKDRRR
jgi:hypothetical protein